MKKDIISKTTFKTLSLLLIAFVLYQCNEDKINYSQPTTEKKTPTSILDKGTNAFVDISHKNTNVSLPIAKKAGLVGLFHKATQGATFVDNKYEERVRIARELNLFMGAYHFGSGEPVEKQIDNFINELKKQGTQKILPVLDWEVNPVSKEGTMTKDQAIQFITLFHKKTGVYPMIYGGYWMLNELREEKDIEIFSKTALWQGFYSSTFGYLDGIWSDWSFLQYTDGKLGPTPHEFEGIGKVDRDVFNGSLQEVKEFWKQHALK